MIKDSISIKLWIMISAIVICLVAGTAIGEEGFDYLIGPGDVLEISVWKNPDLTRVVTVLPDGKISFPLIDQVTAAGKTLAQLSQELRTRLERFVPSVDLSVIVAQVNSQVIYVIGRVNKPGRIAMNTPLNVIQALATAGGLTPFAKSTSIKIYREKEASKKYLSFDYEQVIKGENLGQNILLKRGDVIVVP